MATAPSSTEAARLEALTRRYYDLVDRRALDEMFELFDESIVYERGGTPTIEGIEAFRAFYLGTRTIEAGAHRLDFLVVDPPWTITQGEFHGTVRGGEEVAIGFADFLRFGAGDRVVRRYTYFLGRTV